MLFKTTAKFKPNIRAERRNQQILNKVHFEALKNQQRNSENGVRDTVTMVIVLSQPGTPYL